MTMGIPFSMDLTRPLSHERLGKYRPVGGSDLQMLTNYFWNIKLAETLVPCLHLVEVALRNTIHTTLSHHFGTDMWFYENELLESNQMRDFAFALGKVSKKSKPWPGRIVAELNFHFWISLLNAPYEQRLWQPDGYALLFVAFPSAEGWSRKQISDRFTAIKELRNWAFHHEPIWNRPNLKQEHMDIYQAIEWISPSLHHAVQAVDTFEPALAGKSAIEAELMWRLGLA